MTSSSYNTIRTYECRNQWRTNKGGKGNKLYIYMYIKLRSYVHERDNNEKGASEHLARVQNYKIRKPTLTTRTKIHFSRTTSGRL